MGTFQDLMNNIEKVVEEMLPHPLGDRVLIRPAAAATMHGSLYLPNAERPQQGEVVDVGPDVDTVRAGSVVLYGKYSGTEIEVNGSPYLIMRQSDLLAVY